MEGGGGSFYCVEYYLIAVRLGIGGNLNWLIRYWYCSWIEDVDTVLMAMTEGMEHRNRVESQLDSATSSICCPEDTFVSVRYLRVCIAD